MVLSLYAMVVCLIFAFDIQEYEKISLVMTLVGCAFCFIAEVCYSTTIDSLREDIVNLKKQIDNIKE